MFINREKEIDVLRERYNSKKPEFLIIYGRRRAGKTVLIHRFIKDKPHVYYLADQRNKFEQLKTLSELFADFFRDEFLLSNPFSTWEHFFTYIKQKHFDEKFILIFDEYPYLVQSAPELSSLIQKHWDDWMRKQNIFLILCGSLMSFMEKETLSYHSPLYGRRTGQIELLPFNYKQAAEMLSLDISEKLVQFIGVYGTIPAYLEKANPRINIWNNIKNNILKTDGYLYNEVRFLLMQELRSPRNYFSILSAISQGKNRINDIVQITGLERGLVAKFINNLIDLRIVERKVPVTENPMKSRKGIYIISDNYFRFWFRYIYPNLSFIEESRTDYVLKKIKQDFNAYLGFIFEDICREFLRINHHFLPIEYDHFGSWWHRNNEIDILAFNENEMIVGECKFTNKKVGMNILDDLKRKSQLIFHEPIPIVQYLLFSKSGFTNELMEFSRESNISLIKIEDM